MPPALPPPFRTAFRLRCSRLAEARSQLVDGSIDHEQREVLLRHLGGCADCRAEVVELRRIRSLLSGSSNRVPGQLQSRLVSIAAGSADEPLWARPFRRVRAGSRARSRLPSPRRRLRRRAAAAATAFGTLVVASTGVGYLAAPTTAGAIADPTVSSRADFAAVRAGLPLTSTAATAVLMVGHDLVAAPTVTASLSPASLASTGASSGSAAPSGAQSAAPLDGAAEADALTYRAVSSSTGRRLDSDRAVALLQTSERAASRVAYSATESVTTRNGASATTAEVTADFVPGDGTDLWVRDAGGSVIGSGSLSAPTWSSGATAGSSGDLTDMVGQRYQLSGVADVLVLGRRAAVIEARTIGRPEQNAPTARWWIDQSSGLLLGRQTYDQDGTLVQSVMATSLITGAQWVADHSAQRLVVSSANATLAPASSTTLNGQGWHCPQTIAGLSLSEVRTDVAADPGLVQLIYTDGVFSVSVFERRGVLASVPADSVLDPGLGAYLSDGAPRIASWQSGDSVITVATDGPDSLLAQVVHSLPHDQHRTPTTMERVRAGWSRVVSSIFG